MLLLKIVISASLLLILVQDLKSRSVHWVIFPILCCSLLTLYGMEYHGLHQIIQPVLANLGFLAIQLLMLTAYISIKNGKWTNITEHLLGWGDILFLISSSVYFSELNFLIFYTSSLTLILFFYLLWRSLPIKQNPAVPLAGIQALLLGLVFIGDWYFHLFNLTDDHWLLNLFNK